MGILNLSPTEANATAGFPFLFPNILKSKRYYLLLRAF